MKKNIEIFILPFVYGVLLNIICGLTIVNWEWWIMATIYVGTILIVGNVARKGEII